MAIKTVGLQAILQSKVQEAKEQRQQQQSASSAAVQSGSTSTPTVTATPKVASTPKAQPSIQQSQPTQQVQQINPKDLLGTSAPTTLSKIRAKTGATGTKVETPDLFSKNVENEPNLFQKITESSEQASSKVQDRIDKNFSLFDITDLTVEKVKEGDVTAGTLAKDFLKSNWYGLVNWSANTQRGIINSITIEAQNKLDKRITMYGKLLGLDDNTIDLMKQKRVLPIEDFRNRMNQNFDETIEYLDKNSGRLVSQYLDNNIGLRDTIKHGDVRGMVSLLGNQFGSMAPVIAAGIVTKGKGLVPQFLSMFGINLPQFINESFEAANADESIKVSDITKLRAAYAAGALKSIIEAGDTLFEFFGMGKSVPVKKSVMKTLIKKKIASIASEMGEEMAQYEVDELMLKMLGSDRDWTSFGDLVKNVGFEAAVYALFFPTGTIEGINQKKINTIYEEVEKKIKEDMPEATTEQVEAIAKEIVGNIYKENTQKNNVSEKDKLVADAVELTNAYNGIEMQLEVLRQNPEENQQEITKQESQLKEIENKLIDIDSKLGELEVEDELPAQQESPAQQPTPQQQGGENLSQQTMTSIQVNQNEAPTQDKQKMQESFERSVEQMGKEKTPYNKTDFAAYAYGTSGRTIIGNEQQRGVMIKKVESLLKRIGITPQYRKLGKGIRGRYDQTINGGKVTYKVNGKEITVYGHEVFHAMMDVIMNGELDDKMMQESLRRDMQDILNDAKEHLGLNDEKYSKGEYRKYADMYAEEWLSNAFGEYLANREITGPNMPKTFLEKVVDFFNRVIDFFQSTTNKKTEQELSDAMERVFRTIAEGRVEGGIVKRSPNVQLRQMGAMDESFAETDDELRQTQGEEYDEIVENTKQEQENLNEGVNNISDNGPELISEVEDNQQEGEIVDDAMKEDIEEDKEPDTTEPLDVAVNKVVNKVEKSVDKMIKDKNKKSAIREVGQGIKDVFTPALSRLYSISPRLAGAVHVYQASVGLKTLGYKRLSEDFVKAMDKLRKKNKQSYKKLSLALFDYGMVDDIDIKETLKEAGIDPKLFEPVVSILNRIATEYKEAGLDITINDKYFPRKVKDYGLLLDYLSRKSGKSIEGTKEDLLNRIKNINEDPSLSDGEKEVRIHNILINEFTKPSERSNNAKERKLVLSEWLLTDEEKKQGYKNDITDFYEDPIVSLSNYIDDMVKKTELKKMLGGLTDDKTAISDKFDDSISRILLDMQDRGELTPEKAEEAKKVINAIINAKATGPIASKIKNLVYSMTIANWLSTAQQLEDLSKTLLRGPSGLKNIVKSITGRAGIKMDDTGLDNLFAEFEKGGSIADVLFKLSGFDAIDSLGKKSFLNTAYDSCVRQANGRKAIILETRLKQMYGEEMGTEIFNAYKNDQLKDENGNINLSVMIDLLYQLGNTQPIYKSAMPVAYLNNPKIRIAYCLWSFTIKQVDWIIQGTKEVYNNQLLLGKSKAAAGAAAAARCTYATSVVSIISALVQELINWAKGDEDDLMFKKLKEEGLGAFLKQFGFNSLAGLLKIFNISKYDQYIFNRDGLDGVLINKITPAPFNIGGDIIQILIGKDKLSDMGKYMPLFLKPLYYQFKNHDMLPDYKLWGKPKKSDEEWNWDDEGFGLEDNEEWDWS